MICPSCGAVGADDGALCASCGRVLDPSGRLPVGYSVAGRYELKRFLGEGGMGTVYEAFDRKLEDRVGLKILKPDFAHSMEMERRFRHEIKLSRRIRHPNVCGIHEYGEAGPLRYISMELIEGTDLKHRLRDSGAFPAAEGFRVGIQIAQGLDAIHRAGVVHRDLKASNVMLDIKGDVRLMDFGIAKQIGAEATLGATAVGSIIGTPEYMSPEQGRGETIDYRSDLYSLGIVIYEIFTGDVPFRGDTPIATIFKTIQDPLDLEGPRAQGIPVQLRPVLMKALAKTAEERYASADEMCAALVAARDAALGPGATFAFPATRIEYPTTHIDADRTTPTPMSLGGTPLPPRTPTPAPPRTPMPSPPVAATQLSAPPPLPDTHRGMPLAQARPVASSPAAGYAPLAPAAPAGAKSVLPLLLAGVGLGLLMVGGAAIVYFWPSPQTPPATLAEGAPSSLPTVSPSAMATVMPPLERVTPAPLAPSARPSQAVTPATTLVTPPTTLRSVVSPPTTAPRPTLPPATPRATTTTTVPQEPGRLQLYVRPWANVTVDGRAVGTTPMRPLELAPGTHVVLLKHNDFAPLTRQVLIEAGQTHRLEIDFSRDGQRIQ
jgi:serine/threonine protein kinase